METDEVNASRARSFIESMKRKRASASCDLESRSAERDMHLYTIKSLARSWHCSELFIRKRIKEGDLKSVRLGRAVRIRASDAAAWLEGRK
jgi:excisionase family DNA binding protein